MGTTLKIILTTFIGVLFAAGGYGIAVALDGDYMSNAGFISSLFVGFWIVIALYAGVRALRLIWRGYVFILAAVLLQSCNYAKSNQQVVISDDCGKSWRMVNAGQSVPKGVGNPCYMRVVMPNYPMQGESRFIANLAERVRARTHIDYDYSITEPLSFIKQAKYLGKANSDADSEGALNPREFEGAENMVIDKRIKDVAKTLFLKEDIVELDQAELENALLIEANKILEPLGVTLNFITLTFDLDEQTRQAIDVATAMKIYQSKDLVEVGKAVMSQRAGAPRIIIETKSDEPQRESE